MQELLVQAKAEIKDELQKHMEIQLERIESWSADKFDRQAKQLADISERGIYSDLNTLNDIAKQLDKIEKELTEKQGKIDEFLEKSHDMQAMDGELAVYEKSMRMLRTMSQSISIALSLVQNQRYSFDELTSMMRRKYEAFN